jgi:hypothetical protein
MDVEDPEHDPLSQIVVLNPA